LTLALTHFRGGFEGFGFFWPLHFGGSPQRRLSKEWARANPWAIDQIDTCRYKDDLVIKLEGRVRESRRFNFPTNN